MRYILSILLSLSCCLATNAHPSYGIAVDREGTIYFADIFHNGRGSVWKLDTQMKLTLLAGDFHAHNLLLDKKGRLITASSEGGQLLIRIDGDNAIDTLFVAEKFAEFNGGNFTLSPGGKIYFSIENYIWELQKDGSRRRISDFALGWNQLIYADENGKIYAPDIASDNGRLVRIAPDGSAEIIAQDLISRLDRPYERHNDILMGITKGPDGAIYIAEIAGQRIIRIDPKGEKKDFYQSEGQWFPTGITFRHGKAYILESNEDHSLGPQITTVDAEAERKVLFNFNKYEKRMIKSADSVDEGHNTFWGLLILLIFAFTLLIPKYSKSNLI